MKRKKGAQPRRAAMAKRGQLGVNARAPATTENVAPSVARFQWDAPKPAPTTAATTAPRIARDPTPETAPRVARAPASISPPQDPVAAALAFIEHMPRLPGDLETMEGFLPGAETPKLMSAAAMAHLRGTLPPELDPKLQEDEAPARPVDPVIAKKSRMSGQVAGLAFLIAGITFSGWIGQSVARDAEATHWKAVKGEVTLCKSELVSRNPDRYEQLFAYKYKVGSTWLTGKRVRFAGGQGDPVRAHRVGEKINVYVDPRAAKISVLEPGVIGWAWAQLVAGLVVAALGGLYLMLGGRQQ